MNLLSKARTPGSSVGVSPTRGCRWLPAGKIDHLLARERGLAVHPS
jgi:hypothetical protein